MTKLKSLTGAILLGLATVGQASGVEAPPTPMEVKVPMRDGVALVTDVWLPEQKGKFPLILIRTPYGKRSFGFDEYARYFSERGYAVAIQDTRGRNESPGEFQFFFAEGNDGYDTIESLAASSWSNGRVGMMGASYFGTVQWLAAAQRPPHLVCIASTSALSDPLGELPYSGGAFRQSFIDWFNFADSKVSPLSAAQFNQALSHRPLATSDEAAGVKITPYRDFLQHPPTDRAYWNRITLGDADFKRINLPTLHIAGWFDSQLSGAMRNWNGIASNHKSKEDQFLVIGPWNHYQTWAGGSLKIGDLEFSEDSVIDFKELHLAFFDKYLKGSAAKFDQPRTAMYIPGSDIWVKGSDAPKASEVRYYLSSSSPANTLDGGGQLALDIQGKKTDSYVFDPQNPVPLGRKSLIETMAEALSGAEVQHGTEAQYGVDRREAEKRNDILVYTSDKLTKPLTVVGSVNVELYAATDGKDTDFTASIIDVQPDGRAILIGSKLVGIVRARYRDGSREQLLMPGAIEKYVIDLGYVGYTFKSSHQIRIEISSSAAPYFNSNPNTGLPIATDTSWRVAKQIIYHGGKFPSAIVLPVVHDFEAN